jgi:hypothetical protein
MDGVLRSFSQPATRNSSAEQQRVQSNPTQQLLSLCVPVPALSCSAAGQVCTWVCRSSLSWPETQLLLCQ